jgi:hypothetical protein
MKLTRFIILEVGASVMEIRYGWRGEERRADATLILTQRG